MKLTVAGSEWMTQRVETSAASFLEEVREARRMSPEEKLIAGARLFDYAVAITLAGIRNANPGAGDDEVMRILEKRLNLAEKLDSIPFSLERSGLDDHAGADGLGSPSYASFSLK